jgi:predicted ester cyclase
MPNNNRKKEILTEFIREVWSEGNIDCSDKYLAQLYTIHHDPGDPWDKKELDLEGYKERVRQLRAPFPDQCFEVQELFADGNTVVVSWFWKATHKGDLPGFLASGREIRMSGATVYYFEGERITGHWQITDRLGVYQQLRSGRVG